MFPVLTLGALLACLSLVRADPTPTTPGPNDVFNAGGQCTIAWTPDTTGIWTVMNIELMTGSNSQMVFLTTVATVDGTSTTNATFSYPCPAVTPNSAIYFYQFTSPASNDTLWTTRFALADASGASTAPTNPTQPDGEAIPWGTGALVNPASATPPPAGVPAGNTTMPTNTTSTPLITTTPAANPLPPAVAPAVTPAGTTSATTTSTGVVAAATPGGASANATNGAGVIVVDNRIWAAVTALVAAAVTFTVAM